VRPNFLHFPQRFICISPQLGQRNFVASVPGGMGLPQLVHVTNDNVAVFSSIEFISVMRFVIVSLPYIFYACLVGFDVWVVGEANWLWLVMESCGVCFSSMF
jgi:hypothetical protein